MATTPKKTTKKPAAKNEASPKTADALVATAKSPAKPKAPAKPKTATKPVAKAAEAAATTTPKRAAPKAPAKPRSPAAPKAAAPKPAPTAVAPNRVATLAKRGGIVAGVLGAIGATAAFLTLRGSSRKRGPKDSDS